MYNLILVTATLACFVIASIMDIRKREIADYVSGFLVIFAGLVRFLWFFTTWEISAIFPMILISPLTFAVSYIAYKKNLWGGGDVKLLSAASVALTGFPNDIFFHYFVINLLFVGAFYGAIYSIGIIIKNIKSIEKKTKRRLLLTSALSSIAIIILTYLQFIITEKIYLQILFLADVFAVLGLSYPFAKLAENKFFYKKRKIELLTEGDWLAEDVKMYGKVVIKDKTMLEKKHLELLKKIKKDEIMIKEGIPFVPSFLVTLIFTSFFQDFFLKIMFGI